MAECGALFALKLIARNKIKKFLVAAWKYGQDKPIEFLIVDF